MANSSSVYPLTEAQVQDIAGLHDADTQELESRLLSLINTCARTCTAGFAKCSIHQREMREVYQDAYTSVSPGRWVSYRAVDYLNDLQRLFETPMDLEKINERVHGEKLQHIKDSQCTIGISDHPAVKSIKMVALGLYDQRRSQAEIDCYIREQQSNLRAHASQEQQDNQTGFDQSKSETDKYSYLKAYACTLKPRDTPRNIELRSKWARLFDSKQPYQDIVLLMEKDIADAKANMQHFENRLADLQNAQAANSKAQAAKEEKRIKRAREAVRHCSSERCDNICELSGPNADLGCEMCYEMKEAEQLHNYSWFCTPECAQANAESHMAKFHPLA